MVKRLNIILLVAGLTGLFVLGLPRAGYAQGGGEQPIREVSADEVNAVSSQLYCPVCENIPLDVCGTAACARWREQVRTLLEEGKSETEVINYFVTQFGERVVGTPLNPTLNFLSWAVPAAAAVLGFGAAGYVLMRWRVRREDTSPADDEAELDRNDEDYYRSRLERELREQHE